MVFLFMFMHQDDPGWRLSLRGLWWYAIPFVGLVMRARARRKETNGLIVLRSVFLGLVASLFLFLIVLSFIEPWDGGDERWIPWAVAGFGMYALAAVVWIRRRPLAAGPPEALAAAAPEGLAVSYRASLFIGVALAEPAALAGLVGAIIGGSLWIYLVGLAFTLVGLWMIAPTRLDIERKQREITAAGCPLSLMDALISVPPGRH